MSREQSLKNVYITFRLSKDRFIY